MTAYVALVRAVNVSGTGKLPKERLHAMGEECGFGSVRTFINSGNLLFTSSLAEEKVKQCLLARLEAHFGRPVGVHVRTAGEMKAAAEENPFADDKPSRVMAHFIDARPVQEMLDEARDIKGERLALGQRLIYVSYGEGIGRSRLKLPAVKAGTARNMNSVTRIAALLAELE